MDGAGKLARRMLDAVNLDSSVLESLAKGLISFPVDMYYLGYRFLDTNNSRLNADDTYRLAHLLKNGVNSRTLEETAKPFLDAFFERVDYRLIGASMVGKSIFTAVSSINLGKVMSSKFTGSLVAGLFFGTILSIGGQSSRAIYTSRALSIQYPKFYRDLRQKGNLDLLYFLVQDRVQPFLEACELNKDDFDAVCKAFFEGAQ